MIFAFAAKEHYKFFRSQLLDFKLNIAYHLYSIALFFDFPGRPDFNIEKCVRCPRAGLFEKDEEYRQNKAEKSCEVVPLKALPLEYEQHYDTEYRQGDYFLNDFQLQKVEGASVQGIADTVGRYCEAVFEECYPP